MAYTNNQDTICAIATPAGKGSVAMLRVSGPESLKICTQMFHVKHSEPWASHTVRYGRVVDPTTDEVIDEAVATFMQGPHSYTGEDVVEITCHGSTVIAERILELLTGTGARLAEPGEFTFRAFLNERLDLTQAEAVAELIDAGSAMQSTLALKRLRGGLRSFVEETQGEIGKLMADLGADIDFPEAGLELMDEPGRRLVLAGALERMKELVRRQEASKPLCEGIKVVLSGPPNVGKSTLLNRLVGASRAIVHAEAGTTRDYLEAPIEIDGVLVKFIDTAGIREGVSISSVEAEGIERAIAWRGNADIVLEMEEAKEWGGTKPVMDERVWKIWNKADALEPGNEMPEDGITISAKQGDGVDELLERLRAWLKEEAGKRLGDGLVTNLRQARLLESAHKALSEAMAGLDEKRDPELVMMDLTEAQGFLDEVKGVSVSKDLLDDIFGQFCLGK